MSIADELEKLSELRRQGAISSEEFETAKRKVLESNPSTDAQIGAQQLEEIRAQGEIAQLDREWEFERDQYMVQGKYGQRYQPTRFGSVAVGILIVSFGVFWTWTASSMTGFGHGDGPASFFPLFGVLFILFGAGMSVYSFAKAGQYEEAERRYQRRRRAVLSQQKRE